MPSFFSIILPTYNRANFLPKAIESVIAQTFQDWELIIVDDGSTDNTKEVVGKFKDERISYIYQEKAERSAARNNGIRNAKEFTSIHGAGLANMIFMQERGKVIELAPLL